MEQESNTRGRIVDCGTKAFVAKSYNGCGLNEILCAAGVPKGSFYHYFKSKEDLGVAAIESSADEKVAILKQYLYDRSKSPLARIRALYEWGRARYAEQGMRRDCLLTKFALETAQLSEPMRVAVKCGYDQWACLLAKTLREAQAVGELSADEHPEHLANLIINAWEGAIIRMEIEQDIAPLDEFIEYILNRVLPAS